MGVRNNLLLTASIHFGMGLPFLAGETEYKFLCCRKSLNITNLMGSSLSALSMCARNVACLVGTIAMIGKEWVLAYTVRLEMCDQ